MEVFTIEDNLKNCKTELESSSNNSYEKMVCGESKIANNICKKDTVLKEPAKLDTDLPKDSSIA